MKIVSPTELTLEALDCTKPRGILYWRTSPSLYDSNVQSESYMGRLVGSVSPNVLDPKEYPMIPLRMRIPQISVQQPELESIFRSNLVTYNSTWRKLLHFSELQFPVCKLGDNTIQLGVLRTKQHWVYKMLSTMPGA